MTPPLVSVVIPTHNRQQEVARAIRSALDQSHRHLEILVVDDGSQPPLKLDPEIAGETRVRLLRSPTPQGPGAARNLGAAEAKGTFLAWLDDDDWWFPQKLERELIEFENAPAEVAAVESGYEIVEDGRIVLSYIPRTDRSAAVELLKEATMAPSSVIMRKSAFDALGGFDPSLPRAQDWELWLRLIDGFAIRTLPEIHVRRTGHRAPVSDLLISRQRIWERIQTRLPSLPGEIQREVESHHLLMEGILFAELGRRGLARKTLWHAWRLRPANLRALVHIGRTVTGETLWNLARRTLKPTWRGLIRLAGRDPLLRRW